MRRVIALALVVFTSNVCAQTTTVPAKDLALKSSGVEAPNGGWKLDCNGYIGTFIRLKAAGQVGVQCHAEGQGNPHINVVIADQHHDDVLEHNQNFIQAFDLPAGTYFVRVEMSNHTPQSPCSVRIGDMTFRDAEVLNENTDANALAAADTYIEHFRKGPASVKLVGVLSGTHVHVKLRNHAFGWGVAVSGFDKLTNLDDHAAPGSDNQKYTQAILDHFNLLVPGNAGKWAYNERQRDVLSMQAVDALRDFARNHGLRLRMHAMLWDTGQQPGWVFPLLDAADKGDAAAKEDLRKAITSRIQYYVRDRAMDYEEIDVLNESLHQPRYLRVFGIDGIAGIYNEAERAVQDAGAKTKLCVNEYNLVQWSSHQPKVEGQKSAPDPYANWYREHVESICNAGGHVDAIGVQNYADVRDTLGENGPSAARINQVFQNLLVTGLPLGMTEFGINLAKNNTPEQTLKAAPEALDIAMSECFGTPGVSFFINFGFWGPEMWEEAPNGALFDKDWKPTAVGERYEQLRAKWNTELDARVGGDGTLQFTGFYGDYDLTIGDRTLPLKLSKGTTDYSLDFSGK